MQDGKLVNNPNWIHWVYGSDFANTSGAMFSASPIHLKRNAQEDILPVIITAMSKEAGETRVALLLDWK
jgi:hypothetical protein